jgi:electron transport complex protein RnfB
MADAPRKITRRGFLGGAVRGACVVGLTGSAGYLLSRASADGKVWQIDPHKCIQCGNCATECVLQPSAVKCVHTHPICGYCLRCFAYFDPQAGKFDTAAENQMCPTGAITRRFVEDPYYEYTIDEKLCIGCGKCVKGCNTFGNGSVYLQVRHDRCLNCNQCEIAIQCPAGAFVRVPASAPYIFKKPGGPQ